MKRTDEMKLGEDLRGFCDCNQGRLPCTCKTLRLGLSYKNGFDGFKAYDPPPTTEYPSDRRKDPIERFSVEAQLQLMKALAILGWAAFFLELLRV